MPAPKTTLTWKHSEIVEFFKADARERGFNPIAVEIKYINNGGYGGGRDEYSVIVECEPK